MGFKPIIKNKFISTFIGSIAVFFGIGFIFPISSLSVYITSYIHLIDSSVNMFYGLFIHLIFGFSLSFSHSLGGYFEHLLGFYMTLIVGYIIVFFGNFGFLFMQNIWICYSLSLIIGIGAGISTSLVNKNLALYFPNKKGIINSVFFIVKRIIVEIFRFSGEKIINFKGITLKEDDYFYKREIAERTYLYFLIGIFSLPIGLIVSYIFIYEYKAKNNKIENIISEYKKQEEKPKENTKKKEKNKENQLNKKYWKQKVMQAIKTFRYWRITLILLFINFSHSFIVSTGRTFGAIIEINGKALQYSGTIQSLFSVILAPIYGILADKKGPLLILRIVCFVSIIPPFLLAFFMTKTFIFISCFGFMGIILSGFMVSFSPFIMEVYGIQESVILIGIMNGLSKIADIANTIIAFVFSIQCGKDEKKEKDCLKSKYKIMYLVSGVSAIISVLLIFWEKKDKFKYKNIIDEYSLLEENGENKIIDSSAY